MRAFPAGKLKLVLCVFMCVCARARACVSVCVRARAPHIFQSRTAGLRRGFVNTAVATPTALSVCVCVGVCVPLFSDVYKCELTHIYA